MAVQPFSNTRPYYRSLTAAEKQELHDLDEIIDNLSGGGIEIDWAKKRIEQIRRNSVVHSYL